MIWLWLKVKFKIHHNWLVILSIWKLLTWLCHPKKTKLSLPWAQIKFSKCPSTLIAQVMTTLTNILFVPSTHTPFLVWMSVLRKTLSQLVQVIEQFVFGIMEPMLKKSSQISLPNSKKKLTLWLSTLVDSTWLSAFQIACVCWTFYKKNFKNSLESLSGVAVKSSFLKEGIFLLALTAKQFKFMNLLQVYHLIISLLKSTPIQSRRLHG